MTADQNNREEYNESLLKQTAMTFSLEGISRDLKNLIQKKISHNKTNLHEISLMLAAIFDNDAAILEDFSYLIGEKGALHEMLLHMHDEIRATDAFLNKLISRQMKKEQTLLRDRNDLIDRMKKGGSFGQA